MVFFAQSKLNESGKQAGGCQAGWQHSPLVAWWDTEVRQPFEKLVKAVGDL